MLRVAIAAFVLVAQGCHSPRTRAAASEFRLCNGDPALLSLVSIDYVNLRGYSNDYGEAIKTCGEAAEPCIDFPLLLSAPPRLPTNISEVVQWQVGDDRFAIRQMRGATDAYYVEATEFRPGPDGRPQRFGRSSYTYTSDMGILTFRAEGNEPHWMVRCGGRLTFEDLRALVERLDPELEQ